MGGRGRGEEEGMEGAALLSQKRKSGGEVDV
jgi:hypothetical protein